MAGFDLGAHHIGVPLVLAPMAGITDLPFRQICKPFGVGLVVTEMLASRAIDAARERTERMAMVGDDEHPVSIQIAGSDPDYMRTAARWAVAHHADIVDINMGCPVKKICKQVAGSALLKDEQKVGEILQAVVDAVDVPVSLKIRTGWDEHSKNMVRIARIAEDAGVAMLTVHGRTRAQMFRGHANWEDIALVKQAVEIPVIGNGDVFDGASALRMLEIAQCDGIMVGRAVQGNPWVLAEVKAALMGEPMPAVPTTEQRWHLVHEHLWALHAHYGERTASKLARKHVPWYAKNLPKAAEFRGSFQHLHTWQAQLEAAESFFLASA